jgi:hypothetical protein
MGRAPEVAPVVEVLAAVVLQEATALDKAAPGWKRRMQAALPAHRPERQVLARWEQHQTARRNKRRREGRIRLHQRAGLRSPINDRVRL